MELLEAGSPNVFDASEESFEAFFHQHQRDLTQETFLRAWQHFAKLRTYERPRAWLFRIATNLAIDHQRRQSTPLHATARLQDTIAITDPALRLVERLDEHEAVRMAMLALPLRQRTTLVLRVVYDLSCEEIATTLDISAVAARMTLSRARAQFRKRYSQHIAGEKGWHA